MSSSLSLPEHLGVYSELINTSEQFPKLDIAAIAQAQRDGFGKIGYGFAIEDPLGRVFTVEHKARAENGVTDHQVGILSETVMVDLTGNRLQKIENIASCLVRCFLDEQLLDLREAPDEARLLITRNQPFTVLDWQMSDDGSIPSTLGIVSALRANAAMASYIALNARDSDEARPGLFRPIQSLRQVIENGNYRSAFDTWLNDYTAHYPAMAELSWDPIQLPAELDTDTGNWVDIRFSQLDLASHE